MRFQNGLRNALTRNRVSTAIPIDAPTRSVIRLVQHPVWSDSAPGCPGKTDPRPAVKLERNRVGQIAGSDAGDDTRSPTIHRKLAAALWFPAKLGQIRPGRNSEKSP